jgi:hypothetical protein
MDPGYSSFDPTELSANNVFSWSTCIHVARNGCPQSGDACWVGSFWVPQWLSEAYYQATIFAYVRPGQCAITSTPTAHDNQRRAHASEWASS